MTDATTHAVAVVGAGPAGLFATRALAAAGCRVLLINRDIKAGGLAEYGIFLNKYKMKGGLRNQFHKILTNPRVTYLGHVAVGESAPLSVSALRAAGFDAVVFAIGAQGTKYLGIEGERRPGVYHAKDLVYHYNRLPPFSERHFPIGRRVAIVGVGNVMVDIANYCAHFCECDEIIAVARRGPHEKAYDDREFEDVEDAFDREAYRREVERIRPRLEAAGQSAEDVLKALAAQPEAEGRCRARLSFRFLASPTRVVTEGRRVVALEVEETRLERKDERISAVGTGEISLIPCDTVIFAVGDRVDEQVGLPYKEGLYVTAPGVEEDPAAAYQVWDPARGQPLADVFVVGWARRASDGVVGRARLDAETGIKHILKILDSRPPRSPAEAERPVTAIMHELRKAGARPVTYDEVLRIEAAERERASREGVEEFKFASDDEMLALLSG